MLDRGPTDMEGISKDVAQESTDVLGMKQGDEEMALARADPCQAFIQGHTFNFAKQIAPLFIDEVSARVAELEASEDGKLLQRFGLASMFRDACETVLSRLRVPNEDSFPQQIQPQYHLVFDHSCQALGCTEPNCFLCEANPRRRCTSVFDKKYFKGDILKAKCGAPIFVELRDVEGKRVALEGSPTGVVVEMSILDGNKYDQLFPEGAAHCDLEGLNECALLMGNEGRPLLTSYDRTANRSDGKVVVQLQNGVGMLPDLNVTYSSEALLSGRRPPFRLMVKVTAPGSVPGQIVVPAISEGFVVASGRSRLAQKKCIPSVDDPVGRLEHMGKERVKKLRDLLTTAHNMGVDLPDTVAPEISKVGHFKTLAVEADKDGQLRQKMLHILKMSEKAWDETRDHALVAVTNDTRMRAWYQEHTGQGLVYTCYLGDTDLERPVALIQDGKVVLKDRQTPLQRELVRDLQQKARKAWWEVGHPGWMFYPYDSEDFTDNPNLLPPPEAQTGPKAREESDVMQGHMGEVESLPSIGSLGTPAGVSNGGYLPSLSLSTMPDGLLSESLPENTSSLSSYGDEDVKTMPRRKRPRIEQFTDSTKKPEWTLERGTKAIHVSASMLKGGDPRVTPMQHQGGLANRGPRIISPFENPGQQRVIFSMCHQPPPQPIQPEPPLESPFSDTNTPKPHIVKQQAQECLAMNGRRHQHVQPPESGTTAPSTKVASQTNDLLRAIRCGSLQAGSSFSFSRRQPDQNPSNDSNSVGLGRNLRILHPQDDRQGNNNNSTSLSCGKSLWNQGLSMSSLGSLDKEAKAAIREVEWAHQLREGASIVPVIQSTGMRVEGGREAENTRVIEGVATGDRVVRIAATSAAPMIGGGQVHSVGGQSFASFEGQVPDGSNTEGSGSQAGGDYVVSSNSQNQQFIVLGNTGNLTQNQGNMFPCGLVLLPINVAQAPSSVANNSADEVPAETEKQN